MGLPGDISERQSPFWCVTITETNGTDEVDIKAVEAGLLRSYLFASQKPRSKRAASYGAHVLQMARVKTNRASYDFTYYLKTSGTYIPARALRNVLRRLTRAEMSALLGLQVKTVADTYFAYEAANRPTPQRLGLFFTVLVGLVVVVLVIAFVLCCYINCLRPQASPYWMLDAKQNRLKHVRIHPLVMPPEEVSLNVAQPSAAAQEEEEEDSDSQTSGTNVSSSSYDPSDASSLEADDSSSTSGRAGPSDGAQKVVRRFVDEDSLRIWKKPEGDSDAYDSYKRVRDPKFQAGVAILARLLNEPLESDDVREEEEVRVIEVPVETMPVTTKPRVRTSPLIERDILKLLNMPTQPKPAPFLAPSIEELPSTRILPPGLGRTPHDFSRPASGVPVTEGLGRTPRDFSRPASGVPVTEGLGRTPRDFSRPASGVPVTEGLGCQEMPVQPTSASLASNPSLSSPAQSRLFPSPPSPPSQLPAPHIAPATSPTAQTIFVVDTCRSTMTRRD